MIRRRKRFFVKRANAASAGGFVYAVKGIIIKALIFIMFIFAANLVVRYIVESSGAKIKFSMPSLFASPRYYMIKDNFYVVYSNGKTKIVDSNIDRSSLPVLSGVKLNEDRERHRRAKAAVLKIKPGYLAGISEINVKDPDNIILVTNGGRMVYAGEALDNRKMKNFLAVAKEARLTGKKYKIADMRFRNMIILK